MRLQRDYRESFSTKGKEIPDIVAIEDHMTSAGRMEPKEKFHNIMRHTFAGHYLRLTQSAAETALIMGNTEERIRSNYWELVKTEKEARQYFKIFPPQIVDIKKVELSDLSEDEAEAIKLERAIEAQEMQQMLSPFTAEHQELWDSFQSVIDDYVNGSRRKQQTLWSREEWINDSDFKRTEGGIEYHLHEFKD